MWFSGYNFSNTGQWHRPSASIIDGQNNIGVKFGYDSAKSLWVAIPAVGYEGINITNVANGFGQVTDVKSEDAYIDMLKEIADVSICIEQLIYLLGAEDSVKVYRNEAFEKVRKRYCDTK